jgi:hypothetical protein
MQCDDDLLDSGRDRVSQRDRVTNMKRELRSASKQSLPLSVSDLESSFIPEADDWEHFWVAAASPLTLGKAERYETVMYKGRLIDVPRFQMCLLSGYKDFDGRFSVYPGTRQHISGSVEETRDQLMADMAMEMSDPDAIEFVVDRAIIQLQEQAVVFEDKPALAKWMASESLIMDCPEWEELYPDAKKPAAWFISRWGNAHFTQFEKEVWTSTWSIPLHNAKRLTKEMYASLSSRYSTSKRKSKEEKEEGNLSKRLAAAGEDDNCPQHGAERLDKDKRHQASDSDDEEEDARKRKKKPAAKTEPVADGMEGVSQAQFLNTRPGPYDKLETREQLIAALTSQELVHLESVRAAAEAKKTHVIQYEELETLRGTELEKARLEAHTFLTSIETKCTELSRENCTLQSTVKHMSGLVKRHEEVLTDQIHTAAQTAEKMKAASDTLIKEADDRTAALREKLQLSRKRRDVEMHQFEEALQLVKAVGQVSAQPAQPQQPQPQPSPQPQPNPQPSPNQVWSFNITPDNKLEEKMEKGDMDTEDGKSSRPEIPGYELVSMVPMIAEHPSGIFFNEHELSVQDLVEQIKSSQRRVMQEMGYLNAKGESCDQIRVSMAKHLEMLNEVALAYTSKWFSYPITERAQDRQGKQQLCAQCGTVPGDWNGIHKNKSKCKATKCARCHTLGLGMMGSKDSCNTHTVDTCPFSDENIELFGEYVLRRQHHELKHVNEASLTGDFMNSFNK